MSINNLNLAWDCSVSGATEGASFYLTLSNGAFAFVQVVFSSMGLSPNVQMTARYYDADGNTKYTKSYNANASSFKKGASGMSVECDEVSITQLPSIFKVSFNSGFNFPSIGNKVSLGGEEGTGSVQASFLPKGTISGQFVHGGKTEGIEGDGTFIYALQIKPQNVGQWNFLNFHAPGSSILVYKFNVPTDQEHKPSPSSISSLVIDDEIVYISASNKVVHHEVEFDSFSGHKVPSRITYSLNGMNQKMEEVNVELQLYKIDVLAELPYLVKMFIQTFITAPYIYQWYEKATAIVTIGETSKSIEGFLFAETAFLGNVSDNLGPNEK